MTFRALVSRIGLFFGRGSGWHSWIASILTASGELNWNAEAGARYDNSAVSGAIAWIQRRLTEPVLIVERRGNSREWVESQDHELPDLIENGPAYDGNTLLWATVLSLVVSGNAYWYKTRSASGKLAGFVLMDYTRCTPMADQYLDQANPYKLITYYEFRNPDGQIYHLPPEDVVHFRLGMHPANPRLGMSPIAAALREIVTDNEAANLGVALLKNGGIAGIAFEPTQPVTDVLSPNQQSELADRISRRITGAGAGRPILMPMPGRWRTIGFEPDKLALSQTRALAVSRILSAIGIDPMVLGFSSENKTYSNYAEANESAVENCFLPLLSLIANTLTSQVLRVEYPPAARIRYRVSWDLSQVRALQPDLDALWERVGKAWERNLIKRSEARAKFDLPVDAVADDVYFADVQGGTQPHPGADQPDARFVEMVRRARERRSVTA